MFMTPALPPALFKIPICLSLHTIDVQLGHINNQKECCFQFLAVSYTLGITQELRHLLSFSLLSESHVYSCLCFSSQWVDCCWFRMREVTQRVALAFRRHLYKRFLIEAPWSWQANIPLLNKINHISEHGLATLCLTAPRLVLKSAWDCSFLLSVVLASKRHVCVCPIGGWDLVIAKKTTVG